MRLTILWGTIALLAISTFGQEVSVVDTYGTKANQRENARMNLALHLVFDNFNQPQEAVLIKGITNPTKELQQEVLITFSGDDLKMFGKFDQFNINVYKASSHLGSTADRWRYVRSLSIAQRTTWWKIRIAETLVTERLSPEQIDNMVEIAKALTPNVATQAPDLVTLARLEGVARRVIGKELGSKIFGLTIPGQPCASVTASLAADCGCSNGSYFNSCSGCGDGNGCNIVSDGCGFMGFYQCDGRCGVKDGEIQ